MNDAVLSNIAAIDASGSTTSLRDFSREGRYMLVWWHPQMLTPASCRTCGGSVREPVQLLMDIHSAGCDVVGLTYEGPDRIVRYQQDIGIEYPILSASEDAAREHGVAKVPGEAWPSIPHRIAFLIDDSMKVINRYEVHDPTVLLRTVLSDVKAGPPSSQWEPMKKGFFARLLGR